MAEILLPQWIGGRRVGHEWEGGRRATGGPGDSWKVNLETGAWGGFATGEKGGDLVSLYAALHHVSQLAALEELAPIVGGAPAPVPKLPEGAPPAALAIPPDAPPLPAHREHGEPVAVYRYGNAFLVARYEKTNGTRTKTFLQYTWRAGRWTAKGYPTPRPIYNLEELRARTESPVLIVEGEKCVEAARQVLRPYVLVTWASGAASVKKNDWSVLYGRKVLIWPDADEAGRQAAAELGGILSKIAESVTIVDVLRDDGWDVADAIDEDGWDITRIHEWMKPLLKHVHPRPKAEVVAPADPESDYPVGSAPASAVLSWQQLGLSTGKSGPHSTLANASMIFQFHPRFRDKLWFDSFRGKIYHSLDGTPKPWTDADTRRATAWVQQHLQIHTMHGILIQEAVMHAAECNQRNSLLDWLNSLVWDRTERLDTWLADCLGVERNAYNDAVARNWPISMVARAYQPGCQVDTMPVLEGKMGRGKSRFLDVLAGPWFAAIQIAFGEKDFFQAIQGRWLIEIPDMSGFSKREHTHILATITTRIDVYRKSHGRITEEHPRVTVFAATSENDEYLQESRGRRRYWPLRCGHIDLDALHLQREQVFAEAVCRYKAGAGWHEMPYDATDFEQAARASRDIWTERVLQYVQAYGHLKLTSASILTNAIEMKTSQQDDHAKRRVYRIMMENGYRQLHGKQDRYWVKSADANQSDANQSHADQTPPDSPDDAASE